MADRQNKGRILDELGTPNNLGVMVREMIHWVWPGGGGCVKQGYSGYRSVEAVVGLWRSAGDDEPGGGIRGVLPGVGECAGIPRRREGGRPPYNPVAMFKVLIFAAQNTLSDARM